MSSFIKQPWLRFPGARDGNVGMMFALAAPLLILGIAVAIDFTNASVAHTKLNEAADAAALAALTPAMMGQPDSVAEAAALAMFNARAGALSSLVPGQTQVTVTITHPNGATSRQVAVTYNAQNSTIFSGVLGEQYVGVSGASTSQSQTPPNIDFYLLLDNSPSMALPATQDGIAQMQKLTPTQDGGNGCAFACHMAATANTSTPPYHSMDTMGNLCTDGSSPQYPVCTTGGGAGNGSIATNPANNQPLVNQFCSPDPYCTSAINNKYSQYGSKAQMDNFAASRHSKIPLRLDELSNGITTLMNTANNYQNSGIYATPPSYRFAAYSMDSLWKIGSSNYQVMPLSTPTSYISDWSADSKNFGVMEMWANNVTCGDSACSSAGNQGDVATNYDNAMSSINATIPAPGNGTNVAGDSPQEVLFFVTDGVEDEQNGARLIQTINGGISTNHCTAIKARGIKIAVLYTQYLAVPANGFYNAKVAPFQSNIGPALQACASPNLYYEAAIGDDLGKALSNLFDIVAQQAALSN